MKPETYEAWYETPRGRWIGTVEYSLLKSLLRVTPESSVIDIGCGTGHFTRLFAQTTTGLVVGLDPNAEWLSYANGHSMNNECYVTGRAEALPFPDRSFDYTVSVTSLCFVNDPMQALHEMVRITRRRIVLGLLNRFSLLYLGKGRKGEGAGGYKGAHWDSPAEVRALLASVAIDNVILRSAIVLPQGTALARAIERCLPDTILLGGFLAVSGDLQVSQQHPVPVRP